MRTFRSIRFISWFLVGILAAAGPVRAEQPAAEAPAEANLTVGTARIEGRIVDVDGKPLGGAVVRACYLEGDASFASEATGHDGEYEIANLPPGYADLIVQTGEGFFLANQVLSFVPAGRIVANFALRKHAGEPTSPVPIGEQKGPACGTQSMLGSAEITQKSTLREFLRSPKGIALVAGSAGVLLVIAAAGGGNDSQASQFTQ